MKIKDAMKGYNPILHLWRHDSRLIHSGSWVVLVDEQAASKVYDDELKEFALQRQASPDDLDIHREFVFARIRANKREDQYGLNSDYFGAVVLKTDDGKHIKYLEKLLERDVDRANIAPITKDEFLKLGVGKSLSIAVLDVLPRVGLDGSNYGIQIDHLGARLQIEWWEYGPQEWRELTKWTIKTIEVLQSILDKHHTRTSASN